MDVELEISIHDRLIGKIYLSSSRIESNPNNPISFSCQSSNDCCSKLQVPITDFDIKRIEDQGYALGQILEELSPMLDLPESDDGNIEKYYWIKRKPFTNTCTFLRNGRCSIHEFKPYSCQIFPFSLRQISQDEVMVLTHPSKMCQNIVKEKDTKQNEKILEGILHMIKSERRYRKKYFEKFGNKI